MTLTDLQQWVADDWKNRSTHAPSVELQLLYVMEELGEVAEAIRKNAGAKSRSSEVPDLGSEFADLVISLTTLANHFEIDLDSEIERFKARIIERHSKGF